MSAIRINSEYLAETHNTVNRCLFSFSDSGKSEAVSQQILENIAVPIGSNFKGTFICSLSLPTLRQGSHDLTYSPISFTTFSQI